MMYNIKRKSLKKKDKEKDWNRGRFVAKIIDWIIIILGVIGFAVMAGIASW